MRFARATSVAAVASLVDNVVKAFGGAARSRAARLTSRPEQSCSET